MSKNQVTDELAGIDLAPLDELTRLKAEIDTLDERLATMESRKASVAEAVYQRVRSDYEGKRRSLEQESAPLKAAARAQYVKLYALLTRLEAEHEASRLDREEIDFRHSLGEFDDAEFERRIASIDASLSSRAAARERALEVRTRFVAAFKSEEDLTVAAAPPPTEVDTMVPPPRPAEVTLPPAAGVDFNTPPPAPAGDPGAATVRMAPLTAEQLATTSPPAPSIADSAATQTMQVLKGAANGAPPRADQTVIIRGARLVPQNSEAGKLTHTVGLKPVLIGSEDGCDVRVPGTQGRHAEIRVSMAGYTISDLGGGVRINGIAIDQHLMRHDDTLEIGPARFTFRES